MLKKIGVDTIFSQNANKIAISQIIAKKSVDSTSNFKKSRMTETIFSCKTYSNNLWFYLKYYDK